MVSKILAFLLFIACAYSLCPSSASYRSSGDYTITLASGRKAILHVPTNYDGSTPIPLVLNFHGLNSNPSQQASLTGFSTKANAEKFFVVYPEGTGNSWNAGGGCCGSAYSNNVDDVGFIRQLLDQLTQNLLCINVKKIYTTGFSNGGYFTYRMACNETGYSLAAVAPVSGLKNQGPVSYPCTLSGPLPLIHFHGTSDSIVPYSGVDSSIQYWAQKNGCNFNSKTTTYSQGSAQCYTLDCPNPSINNMTVCSVTGMGHTWPGASNDIKATDHIWDFFKRFGSGAPTSASVATVTTGSAAASSSSASSGATTTKPVSTAASATTASATTASSKSATVTTGSSVSSSTGSTPGGYIGCFKRSSLSATYNSASFSMTIQSCQAACHSAGNNYAALSSGSQCYCLTSAPSSSASASEASCSTACNGNSAQKCGGITYASVWTA